MAFPRDHLNELLCDFSPALGTLAGEADLAIHPEETQLVHIRHT